MTLTEEQKALYRAVADGKRVEWFDYKTQEWKEWTQLTMRLGHDGFEWRLAPETITITIPRPVELNDSGKNTAWIDFASPSDVKAFIDAVRGAK